MSVRASRYSYRSSGTAGATADVNIEYSADLSALTRLEVGFLGRNDRKNCGENYMKLCEKCDVLQQIKNYVNLLFCEGLHFQRKSAKMK